MSIADTFIVHSNERHHSKTPTEPMNERIQSFFSIQFSFFSVVFYNNLWICMRTHIQHSIVVGPFLINLKSDAMQSSLHYSFNSLNENREQTSTHWNWNGNSYYYYLDPFHVYKWFIKVFDCMFKLGHWTLNVSCSTFASV